MDEMTKRCWIAVLRLLVILVWHKLHIRHITYLDRKTEDLQRKALDESRILIAELKGE